MTLIQPAFSAVMVLNIVWFSLAFYFFSVRPLNATKLLVPRGERDSLLFGTVMYTLRFLGGLNFALALLALVLAAAHASQCAFNMPLVLNQRGMPGASRVGLSRPMRMIFAVDCVMTVANTTLWLMLWRVG